MENIRITLENQTRCELKKMQRQAENKGDLRGAKRITAIFGISEGLTYEVTASVLNIEKKTVIRCPEMGAIKSVRFL